MTGLLIMAILGVIIVRYWLQLYIVWQLVQAVFYGCVVASIGTVIWHVITPQDKGYASTWWIVFIGYWIVFAVMVGVFAQAISLGVRVIRNIFKIR